MALQVIQNFAIRRIFRLNWNYPNRLLYPISNILPLKLRFLQLGCRQLTKAMSHNPLTISLVREYMGSISSINTKGRTSTPLCVFLPIVVLAYALRIFILLVSLILWCYIKCWEVKGSLKHDFCSVHWIKYIYIYIQNFYLFHFWCIDWRNIFEPVVLLCDVGGDLWRVGVLILGGLYSERNENPSSFERFWG